MNVKELIEKLSITHKLEEKEYEFILDNISDNETNFLYEKAREKREENYNKDIYIRGLIEFSNYCKNNCFYCGIGYGNKSVTRYRLSKEEILLCASEGYKLGFRTFVLQSGEDPFFTREILGDIILALKDKFNDCAITLSVGEKSREDYEYWYRCGAERYLLRHETADKCHYEKLHPKEMSYENRMRCLYDLKEIGYQVGAGFMVGSPWQTNKNLAKDLVFLQNFKPHMVGIGPFISQKDTIFADKKNGTLNQTLILLALIRLALPYVLLPATTALGTISPNGRKLGVLAGANVVMPNLSPMNQRKNYSLYDNKISQKEESAQGLLLLKKEMKEIGYKVVESRGDNILWNKKSNKKDKEE